MIYPASIRKSGITVVEQAGRRIHKLFRPYACIEGVEVEMDGSVIQMDVRKVRLPTKTIIESQPRCGLPRVCCIQREILASIELLTEGAHREIGRIPQKEIRHS